MPASIIHPGQAIYQNLSDEEKHLLLEVCSNPVLRGVLLQYQNFYKEQQLELQGTLAADEFKAAYLRFRDAQDFSFNFLQFLELVINWHKTIQRS